MRIRTALVLGTLGAAVVLALTVSASAHRLTGPGVFRTSWLIGHLLILRNGAHAISCPVTIEGTYHSRTIAKVSGALIGHVTNAFVGAPSTCLLGSLTVRRETLPWHVRYDSFAGTLPNIASIKQQLVGARFGVTEGAATCDILTSAARPLYITYVRGATDVSSASAEGTIPTVEGFLCPLGTELTAAGETPQVNEQGANRVTITLVQ